MAKVTSKLQLTIPKALADRCGIKPGDDVDCAAVGDAIRIAPRRAASGRRLDVAARLELFDAGTARQREREATRRRPRAARERGWTREELHDRGSAR